MPARGRICKQIRRGEVRGVWEAGSRGCVTACVYAACAAQAGPRLASINIRAACQPGGGLTQAREAASSASRRLASCQGGPGRWGRGAELTFTKHLVLPLVTAGQWPCGACFVQCIN